MLGGLGRSIRPIADPVAVVSWEKADVAPNNITPNNISLAKLFL